MKLQIDTQNKSIKIEEKVNLKEFFETIDKLFHNLGWKEYSIENTVIWNWSDPIIIEKHVPPYNPWPWNQPYYINYGGSTNVSGVNGLLNTTTTTNGSTTVFNVEV